MTELTSFSNLLSYSLQIAGITGVAGLLTALLRIRQPQVLLIFWQLILLICLILPFVQPWERARQMVRVEPRQVPSQDLTGRSDIPMKVEAQAPGEIWVTAQRLVGPVWVSGAFLKFCWLLVGLRRLGQLRRGSSGKVQSPLFEEAGRRVEARCEVRISDRVSSPVTFGFWAPVVLIPDHFSKLGPETQKAVALHELLHVKRCDWLCSLAEEIIASLLWFHPCAWWLVSRIRTARERVVDSEVLNLTGDARSYAHSLVALAGSGAVSIRGGAPFLGESRLLSRVQFVLKQEDKTMRRSTRLVTVLSLAALTFAGIAASVRWFPLVQASQPSRVIVLEGTVKDPSGALFPNVSVKIVKAAGGEVITQGTTDEAGYFRLATEETGPLHVRIEKAGFKTCLVSKAKGDPLDITLEVGEIAESVKVTAARHGTPAPARQPSEIGQRVHTDLVPPQLIQRLDPIYPEEARRRGVAGLVLIKATIDESGAVASLELVRGDPMLEDAALAAVRQWRYRPALLNRQPWPFVLTVAVSFDLE